jgi:hypothetical protein
VARPRQSDRDRLARRGLLDARDRVDRQRRPGSRLRHPRAPRARLLPGSDLRPDRCRGAGRKARGDPRITVARAAAPRPAAGRGRAVHARRRRITIRGGGGTPHGLVPRNGPAGGPNPEAGDRLRDALSARPLGRGRLLEAMRQGAGELRRRGCLHRRPLTRGGPCRAGVPSDLGSRLATARLRRGCRGGGQLPLPHEDPRAPAAIRRTLHHARQPPGRTDGLVEGAGAPAGRGGAVARTPRDRRRNPALAREPRCAADALLRRAPREDRASVRPQRRGPGARQPAVRRRCRAPALLRLPPLLPRRDFRPPPSGPRGKPSASPRTAPSSSPSASSMR